MTSATPARLTVVLEPAFTRHAAEPALLRPPHQRRRPVVRAGRPRRRLKRGVRLAGVSLGALLLCGAAGLLAHSARSQALNGSTSRTRQTRSEDARAAGEREAHAARGDGQTDLAGWFIPLGVRPAGYLIPDDGTEESAHAGG
jgi:hypothetical protein